MSLLTADSPWLVAKKSAEMLTIPTSELVRFLAVSAVTEEMHALAAAVGDPAIEPTADVRRHNTRMAAAELDRRLPPGFRG